MDTSIFYVFFLIVARVTAFIVTVPVFSSKGVPNHFKLGLSFFIAIIVFPTIYIDNSSFLFNSNFILFLIKETMLGLALGWTAQLIFTAIQVAGSFIDMQIGFAIANVIDPQTGAQSPLMGSFKYIFAILLFLVIDGHHLLLDGIISSYQIVTIDSQWLSQFNQTPMLLFMMSTFSKMFLIAFKIAAPIVGTLFLADVALGIVAKTVPQLNVFVVGLPLKVLLHFSLLFMIVPVIIFLFKELFQDMFISMKQFIELVGLQK